MLKDLFDAIIYWMGAQMCSCIITYNVCAESKSPFCRCSYMLYMIGKDWVIFWIVEMSHIMSHDVAHN